MEETIKKILVAFSVLLVASCSTLGTSEQRLESQLKDAKLLVMLADHFVLTGRLPEEEWKPKIDKVRASIGMAEIALKAGNKAEAIATWQDAVILFMEIDRAITRAKIEKKE